VDFVTDFIDALGLTHPLTYIGLFLAASLLMIWRLEAMGRHGLEGTALGTVVMPYCSGLGNLVFVYLVLRDNGKPGEVMTNCLVNNTTNFTFVIGLAALLWPFNLTRQNSAKPGKRAARKAAAAEIETQLSRLSLMLTMAAVVFFTGITWALGQDGTLSSTDGLVLVALFLFWQTFQVVDVMKHNVRQRHSFPAMFYVDVVNLLLGAVLLYASLDWLVKWLSAQKGGFLSAENLGWLSGWLMVLPNTILALYYAWRKRADVAYCSQIGDAHVSLPLCLGVYALFRPVPVTPVFDTSVVIILAAIVVHFVLVVGVGWVPRWVAGLMMASYAWFLYAGLAG
jgi:cation:H+ antiporter